MSVSALALFTSWLFTVERSQETKIGLRIASGEYAGLRYAGLPFARGTAKNQEVHNPSVNLPGTIVAYGQKKMQHRRFFRTEYTNRAIDSATAWISRCAGRGWAKEPTGSVLLIYIVNNRLY